MANTLCISKVVEGGGSISVATRAETGCFAVECDPVDRLLVVSIFMVLKKRKKAEIHIYKGRKRRRFLKPVFSIQNSSPRTVVDIVHILPIIQSTFVLLFIRQPLPNIPSF